MGRNCKRFPPRPTPETAGKFPKILPNFYVDVVGRRRIGSIAVGRSASERVSERTSERDGFRGFQRFLEVFRGF